MNEQMAKLMLVSKGMFKSKEVNEGKVTQILEEFWDEEQVDEYKKVKNKMKTRYDNLDEEEI